MATGWVKSLQCKSRALDDVVDSTNAKHHYNLIPNSASCRKSVQSLRDVVETTKHSKPRNSNHKKRPVSTKPEPGVLQPAQKARPRHSIHSRASTDSFFPALTELPEGHPSRNVVEIIFHTSWSAKAFSGRVEMVLKVQNLGRTVTRFEEYRELVKARADSDGGGEDHARCIADGNEVMRFYCLGPANTSCAYDTRAGSSWGIHSGKGAAVCTFSGSGAAHENAGGGRGRRAMLVCRVIAGRVRKGVRFDSLLEGRVGYDSASGDDGELLVFDSRAVLPCFLIIYKL